MKHTPGRCPKCNSGNLDYGTMETYDSSGDDLTLTFAAGDVWYANIKYVKVASTATHMGIRLNT